MRRQAADGHAPGVMVAIVASVGALLASAGASLAGQPDTADASAGSTAVYQYTIGADGALMPKTQLTMEVGSRPEGTAVSADGRFAYAVDQAAGEISRYSIAAYATLDQMADDGTWPPPLTPATVDIGADPSAMALSPDGRFAYVANHQSNDISQYGVAADGTWAPMTPATVDAGNGPIAMALDPDGRFAYVANQGSNDISEYSVADDGTLAPMAPATVDAGKDPSAMALSPDGKFAYVANAGSNHISEYSIGAGGTLSPISSLSLGTGSPQPVALVVSYPPDESSSSTDGLASAGASAAAGAPEGLPDPTEIVTDPDSPEDEEGVIIAADCDVNGPNGDYFSGPDPNSDNSANIQGTADSDLIIGGSSSQTIRGNGGDDLIFARAGGDRVIGGGGRDYIFGEDGVDTIYGDQDAEDGDATNPSSNDCLVGGQGNDTVVGDNYSFNGTASPGGGSANDVLLAGQDRDIAIGDSYAIAEYAIGGGNDSLSGATGRDQVAGDTEDVVGVAISGNIGVDSVSAGPSGGAEGDSADTVYGDNYSIAGSTWGGVGEFNDILIWGDTDTPNGQNDTQADPLAAVRGLDGTDLIWGDSFPASGGGSDWITGGGCATGSCGDVYDDDTIRAGPGDDHVKGDSDAGNAGPPYSRSDTIYGEGGDDTLQGFFWADSLYGGDGADSLYGLNGADSLYGEAGTDSCDGGDDTDWAEPPPSCDSIYNVP